MTDARERTIVDVSRRHFTIEPLSKWFEPPNHREETFKLEFTVENDDAHGLWMVYIKIWLRGDACREPESAYANVWDHPPSLMELLGDLTDFARINRMVISKHVLLQSAMWNENDIQQYVDGENANLLL